jgi:hypothetical protein
MMDAADFAGFWLRQQRIGTRGIRPAPAARAVDARKAEGMSAPLVVEIPHRLGKEEAVRRLQTGFGRASAQLGNVFKVHEEVWSGDRLSFRFEVMRQMASGTVDVRDDNVRIEVALPWLLAQLASSIQSAIRKTGTLLLDKKP